MKCFIIVAMSADGYIAKDPKSPSTVWTSKEDKKRFVELTKKAGVIVTGLNTWKTFGGKPLKDRLNVIYSPEPIPGLPESAETTSKTPAELLADLEKRGYSEAAICGGSQIYTMFMKSGLVDELYLTIEPVVFGDGIRLFKEEMGFSLRLADMERTEGGTLLLRYEKLDR
ncbi:dihydrofolate reductase family protein [Patescibacteria group bacterium]|nr:dihydrofolate reductase family protein [Patescibacteria group bacterium]